MSATPSTSKTAAVRTRLADESKENIPLVGRISHQIVGAKLPSKRQVLKVLFFHLRIGKLSTKESARLAIKETVIFWEKARIPIRYEARIIEDLETLHKKWESLRKHPSRRSTPQIQNEEAFVDGMDDLFDIADANALQLIKNQDDIEFLKLQRQKGRPGCMIGVDVNMAAREERAAERNAKVVVRKRKHQEMMSQQSGMDHNVIRII